MFLMSRYHVVVTMGLILSLTSCADTEFIMRPPAPEKLPPAEAPTPEITESVIHVPIQLGLSDFLQAANDQTVIAKQFDQWGRLIKHPNGGEYKYYAERDDFTIEPSGSQQAGTAAPGMPSQTGSLGDWWKGIDLSGSSLFVSAPLRYKIGARSHAKGTETSAQCGDGSGWPRQATLNGSIAIGLTPDYGVSASLRSVTVHPLEPCQLLPSEVDLQQAVNSAIEDQVRGGLNHAASRLNALSVHAHAEEVWTALRNPIQLEPDTWLLLNLDNVRRRGFSNDVHSLHDMLEMTAHPVIVHGTEPPTSSSALPPLKTEASSPKFRGVADVQEVYSEKRPGSEKFHVLADVQIEYATLSRTLSSRLKGKRVVNLGNFITVTGAKISSFGDNQVLLRVEFAGDARGHLYLIGKPEINAMTQTVYFSGLRYDLKTAQLLHTRAPDWFNDAPLRESITPEIVLSVTSVTDRVGDLLKTGLNRTLSPTVSMQGTVTSVSGIAVFAEKDALQIRVLSEGSLSVTAGRTP